MIVVASMVLESLQVDEMNITKIGNYIRHRAILLVCFSMFLFHAPCASRIPCTFKDVGKDIDWRITQVWKECEREGTRDYDENGVVNCCDYATHFCIKWRKKYSEEVRLCQQQTANMNHMYVQIKCVWGWWSVDPRYTTNGTHDMEVVWPRKYSPYGDNPYGYWAKYFTAYIRWERYRASRGKRQHTPLKNLHPRGIRQTARVNIPRGYPAFFAG